MSTSRRGYHHGDLRQTLLREAGQLLERKGIEQVAVRALGRRARVSHAAPYRHFRNRETLLAALATEGFERLGEAMRAAGTGGGARAMGEAYVRYALAHPQRFRLMFGGGLPVDAYPELRASARRTLQGLASALASVLQGTQGTQDAAVAAWALVHGLAHLLLEGRVSPDVRGGRNDDAFVRDVLSTLRFVARAVQSA